MKISEIGKKYHEEHRGNCAQSVAYACSPSDEKELLISRLKECGGGRAEGGLCGALYALKILDEENFDKMLPLFEEKIGHTLCREIRPKKLAPCNRCVEIACELFTQFHPSK